MLHRRLCLPASLLPRARAYCSQRTCTSSADRSPHTPVLLAEVVAAFHGTRLRTHVDCTLGAGGHALAIAEDHPELVTLLGVDVDPEAHRLAQPRLAGLQEHRGFAWHPVQGNFGDLPALLAAELPSGVLQHGVDGVRMDVGVSSMQLDTPERGFSFAQDGPLDMRMGPSAQLSAAAIVNTWPELELARIFRDYGEDKGWRRCARNVADARMERPISTTHELLAALKMPPIWHGRSAQGKRQSHPATRLFQALRIAVNGELDALAAAIPRAVGLLNPGGHLAIITFHSLEDRIAKRALLAASGAAPDSGAGFDNEGPLPAQTLPKAPPREVKLITRKPLMASREEQAGNPRSRSAKLRVVEKLGLP